MPLNTSDDVHRDSKEEQIRLALLALDDEYNTRDRRNEGNVVPRTVHHIEFDCDPHCMAQGFFALEDWTHTSVLETLTSSSGHGSNSCTQHPSLFDETPGQNNVDEQEELVALERTLMLRRQREIEMDCEEAILIQQSLDRSHRRSFRSLKGLPEALPQAIHGDYA